MIQTVTISSPVGYLKIEGSGKGIKSLTILENAQPSNETPDILKECVHQLEEYFQGDRKLFDLPLDIYSAPEFYQDVWGTVSIIPFGRTRSYTDIAEAIGYPNATRAVGQANGNNPIAIIIPCHRVIGKNGKLTGYAHGLEVKRKLLALENPDTYTIQGKLFSEAVPV